VCGCICTYGVYIYVYWCIVCACTHARSHARSLMLVYAMQGKVRPVKVLGILCMIDEGEADWKVVAIDREDPWCPPPLYPSHLALSPPAPLPLPPLPFSSLRAVAIDCEDPWCPPSFPSLPDNSFSPYFSLPHFVFILLSFSFSLSCMFPRVHVLCAPIRKCDLMRLRKGWHIYIYMYVYLYIHVYMYTYIYISVCVCICIYTSRYDMIRLGKGWPCSKVLMVQCVKVSK